MRRHRFAIVVSLIISALPAFWFAHLGLQRHSHVKLLNQLMQDATHLVNNATIVPGDNTAVADLQARFAPVQRQALYRISRVELQG